MVHARRDSELASRKLVIITGRSCERVDHKVGLHFTLLRIKHECWQQLKSWKKLVKKLHCQTMECLAEAETEGAILALLLHCLLFKQSSCVTKSRNEGRDHGNK